MKDSMMVAMNSSDKAIEEEIDKINADANKLIQHVLQDQSLSAEEQHAAIARIDDATRSALKGVAMKQKQMESNLGSFVKGQDDAKKAMVAQLGGLDQVMTGSQMTWFRGVLKEKQ